MSQNLIQYRDHPKGVMARIPAHEVEKTVCNSMRQNIIIILELDQIEDHGTIQHINDNSAPIEDLVKNCVTRISVDHDKLEIEINILELRQALQDYLKLHIPIKIKKQSLVISVPFSIRRAHKGTIILKPENSEHGRLDSPPAQLKNLLRGIIWRDQHFAGTTLLDIAKQENLSEAGVRKIIMGSFDTLVSP